MHAVMLSGVISTRQNSSAVTDETLARANFRAAQTGDVAAQLAPRPRGRPGGRTGAAAVTLCALRVFARGGLLHGSSSG